MNTVDVEIAIRRKGRANPAAQDTKISPALGVPRVAHLMALAIKFQDMVDHGEVRDYADLARLGYVSRARLTQIMNLLLLAPDIQEQMLFGNWPAGKHTIRERDIRGVCREISWAKQRSCFRRLHTPRLSKSVGL